MTRLGRPLSFYIAAGIQVSSNFVNFYFNTSWDELHKLSRKQSQVFEEGVKAAEERGRKKSVSQQWRAESSSSRTQERR